MKRKLALLLSLVLILGLIAACAQAEDTPAANGAAADGETVTINWWVWGDYEELGLWNFHTYHPNIVPHWVVMPTEDIVPRFQTVLAAGGEQPDVLNIEIADRAFLHSLDNVFHVLDDDPFNLDRSVLVDFAIPLMTNLQDQVLSVQIDNCVGGYVFNRELAREFFGTDDPDEMAAIFSTPQAFIDQAAIVNQMRGGEVVMFASAGDAFRAFSSLGVGSHAPVVINDTQLNIRYLFMDTLNIIEGLVAENMIGTFTDWTPPWFSSFATGDVIFYAAPTWFMSHVLKPNDPDGAGNWGFMRPPGGSFSWGGTSYAIPLGAPNPMEAWTAIEWFTMTQEGAESFFYAHHTPSLFAPAYDTDLFLNNPDPFFAGQDVVALILEIAEDPNTRTRPLSPFDTTIIIDAAAFVWVEMVDNGMSAEDAVTFWEDQAIFLNSSLHR